VGVHILDLKTAPLPTFFPETEEFFRAHLLVGDIIISKKLIFLAKRRTSNAFRVNFPFWAYILTGQPPIQLHYRTLPMVQYTLLPAAILR